MSSPIILNDNEYIHIIDIETGIHELVTGPKRYVTPTNKQIKGSKMSMITLKENQYCWIQNPFDLKTQKNLIGTKITKIGPVVFPIYPHEICGDVLEGYVLTNTQAALVCVTKDFENEKTGTMKLIKGPASYIPAKHELVEKIIDAIQIGENEAIYVQNTLTGKLKMVEGPNNYICNVDERLFYKALAKEQYTALQIPSSPSYKAFQVNIQKNEVVCIIDYQLNKEDFIIGPRSYILKPNEGIKCIQISTGVPKQENPGQMIGVVNLGPDFMEDSFQVRTNDNALLEIMISYKWCFRVDKDSLYKVFEGDFIGYSCQSLRSRIREESSKWNFEKFHTDASQIIRASLFKEYEFPKVINDQVVKVKEKGRLFREFDFFIFEIDVKKISPVDKEIEKLLDEAIKASMNILCNKLNNSAEFESETQKILSEVEICKLKSNSIEIENNNYSKETIEKTKIENEQSLELAKAQAQSKVLIEKSKIDLEIKNIKDTINLLSSQGGDKYIDYVKIMNLNKNVRQVMVIPNNLKTIVLNGSDNSSNNVLPIEDNNN